MQLTSCQPGQIIRMAVHNRNHELKIRIVYLVYFDVGNLKFVEHIKYSFVF
jgi:hypothetical protein